MLDLPPPYTLVTPPAPADAFAHGCAVAAAMGAGTLVWAVGAADLDIAVVLEPEEDAQTCRQVVLAGLNAAAEALAALCAPEKPIAFRWPDALLFDGGLVGGARLALGPGAVPDWLVLGVRLRVVTDQPMEALTFLDDERGGYVEAFARHLMLELDLWQARGPESAVQRFRRRCADTIDLAALSAPPSWFADGILP